MEASGKKIWRELSDIPAAKNTCTILPTTQMDSVAALKCHFS
jgi:hypothetical protein